MNQEELNEIIRELGLWSEHKGVGKWVNLSNADLRDAYLYGINLNNANFRGANLQHVNVDFSCWPLWCGSLGLIVDARIARQLMYHALAVICDDPEFIEIRNDPKVLAFVNKFHRVEMGDCQELKPIEQKEGKEI